MAEPREGFSEDEQGGRHSVGFHDESEDTMGEGFDLGAFLDGGGWDDDDED